MRPPGLFTVEPVGEEWPSVRDELSRAFAFTKQAAEQGTPVIYLVRYQDLVGRGGAGPAMVACGLLSAARTAALEGAKTGWTVNVLATEDGVDETLVGQWAFRLSEPGGPSGELVRLGVSHLGRLQP